MAIKVKLRVGDVEIEYEGAEAFMIKKIPGLIEDLRQKGRPSNQVNDTSRQKVHSNGNANGGDPGTLAAFLSSKDAKGKQVKRFLATAEWLHQKGTDLILTSEVTAALKENRQNKIGNPADCLNKNVSRGFCEKDGKRFFVTDEGRKELE